MNGPSPSGLIHVIDDDAAVRDSVALLLHASGFPARTWESAEAFLRDLPATEPGCVLTDVRMPGMSGLELLASLAPRRQDFPTIVLTGEADVAMAVEALKNGALDLIEKPYAAEVLLAAVRRALGRLAADRDRAARAGESVQRLAGISAREREVLDGLVAGLANKEIARDLGISPRTVEAYRASLMMKTESESLSDLLRLRLQAREA